MTRQRRYPKEEFARRGDDLYQSRVRAAVEAGNHGRLVAIDIESGAYEVADDGLTALTRLYDRLPDAQPWLVRIGYPAVHRLGARPATISS